MVAKYMQKKYSNKLGTIPASPLLEVQSAESAWAVL